MKQNYHNIWIFIFIMLFSLGLLAKNTCIECHQEETPEIFQDYHQSIHFVKGITCEKCHGGNPTKVDMEDAMSPSEGFLGVPSRKEIPKLCDRCHGDIEYMRQFNPSMRVDQFKEYLTSVHGKKWEKGDKNVAICTDCHTSHKILPASDPSSSIYPLNVPSTCAKCHADEKKMKKYGIPTNQFDLYKQSVHGYTLFKKNDLSAPTCNDCHGNHGAVPPGIRNIAEVCGQCHVVQANAFNASPHKKIFEEMEEWGCITCHSNHKIRVLEDKDLTKLESSVCSNCHEAGDKGFEANKEIANALIFMDSNLVRLQDRIKKASTTGISLDKPLYELQDLNDLLVKSRVAIHYMDAKKIQEIKMKAEKVVQKVDNSIDEIIQDYSNRKRGLYVSIVFILLFVIGIYLYSKEKFGENQN